MVPMQSFPTSHLFLPPLASLRSCPLTTIHHPHSPPTPRLTGRTPVLREGCHAPAPVAAASRPAGHRSTAARLLLPAPGNTPDAARGWRLLRHHPLRRYPPPIAR